MHLSLTMHPSFKFPLRLHVCMRGRWLQGDGYLSGCLLWLAAVVSRDRLTAEYGRQLHLNLTNGTERRVSAGVPEPF